MKRLFAFVSLCEFAITAQAAIQTKAVHYEHEGAKLTGYLYWDDKVKGKRPGVMVTHEWWGLNGYAKRRAHMLAELGYVSFAADMYGDGKVTDKPAQAKEYMTEITSDPDAWMERAALGLEQLMKSGMVKGDKVAAIGYCFGGGTSLKMAYNNMPVKAIVSFHGSFPMPPEDAPLKPEVLILHGEADAFVKPEIVAAWKDKMTAKGNKFTFVGYEGARHGFTNPGAGEFGIENLKYDAAADKDSWQQMQNLFKRIF